MTILIDTFKDGSHQPDLKIQSSQGYIVCFPGAARLVVPRLVSPCSAYMSDGRGSWSWERIGIE